MRTTVNTAVKTLAAALALSALSALSCSSQQVKDARPYLSSAEEVIAELLCAEVGAERAGVSLAQARDLYCSTRDLWLPFLEKALEVKSGAASLSDAKASFAGPRAPAAPAPAPAPSAGAAPDAAAPDAPAK